MEVPNTLNNNSNGSSSVEVPVPTNQKIRITISPNSVGFSITVAPRDSGNVEVVHEHEGHGHRGGRHCRRGMFPHPGMMGRFPEGPMHGGPHHPHFPHFPHSPHVNSPYAAELEQLKSEGFHCIWWIEKLLIMTNGNVEEVRQILNKKKNKKEEARLKWASQLSQLHQMGFQHDWVNLRLLKKYDGDLERTLNKLMDCDSMVNMAVARPCEEDQLKYKTQLEQLHEAGHHRDRFLIYWLKRFDGNVEAVLAKLQKKQNRREAKLARFAPQLEQLRQAGHVNDRCNARLLKAADGDIEKVLRVLNSKSGGCPMRGRGGWGRRFGAEAATTTPADAESEESNSSSGSNTVPGCSGPQEEGQDELNSSHHFPHHFGRFPHHLGHGHGPQHHGHHHGHHHGPHHHHQGPHHHGHGPHFGFDNGAHSGYGFPPHHGMPHCPGMMSFPHRGPFGGMPGCSFGGVHGEGYSPFSRPHPYHGLFGGPHFSSQPGMCPRKDTETESNCH